MITQIFVMLLLTDKRLVVQLGYSSPAVLKHIVGGHHFFKLEGPKATMGDKQKQTSANSPHLQAK